MSVPVFQFLGPSRTFVPHSDSVGIRRILIGALVPDETYGQALRSAWSFCGDVPGLVCLEHDVAVPYEAWIDLDRRVRSWPDRIAAVPYLLYPRSTGRDGIVWAHRVHGGDGRYHFVPSAEPCPDRPAAFGLGCTYLPRRLIERMPDDLRHWDYPVLDTRLSDLAQSCAIPALCTHTTAVHIHY